MEFTLENFKKDGILNCLICYEELNDAHFCPGCSKLCCYSCITDWLRGGRPHCPNCLAPLSNNKLVKCRWIADVNNLINKISSQVKASVSDRNETNFEVWRVCQSGSGCGTCRKCVLEEDLSVERHALEDDRKVFDEERDIQLAEKQILKDEKEELAKKMEEATQQVEILQVDREILKDEKDAFERKQRTENHKLAAEKGKLAAEKAEFEYEKEQHEKEYSKFMAERALHMYEIQASVFDSGNWPWKGMGPGEMEEAKGSVHNYVTEQLGHLQISNMAHVVIDETFKSMEQQCAADDRYIDLLGGGNIKVTARVALPIQQHPHFNFAGKIIGRGGRTIRHLETVTKCTIRVVATQNVTANPNKNVQQPPHVEISCTDTPSQAYKLLSSALQQLKIVITPPDLQSSGKMANGNSNDGNATDGMVWY